jgi:serine/threonine-protein kinase
MGVVYRARDPILNRVVALKMLSAELGAEEELHQRFTREVEAAGRLNHPHIVTIYDTGQSEGQLYMAMELLEGEDLRALIERQAAIPLADKVRILMQIAQGLAYAHSRGVVHRDIKPANILVTSSGTVKVLDFGLARVADRNTITKKGVILGTPDYMSPEQAMGRLIDPRSDVFSAGAVYYEFLTQRKPFGGKTLHAVLYQIVSEQPQPVLTLNPELPARLARVIHRMLEKDPERRYATMEQLINDLEIIHVALRRSRSRSALPSTGAGEDPRMRVRELVQRARSYLEAGRAQNAVSVMDEALALDPAAEDAAEIRWRARRSLEKSAPALPADPVRNARIEALLKRAAPGRPAADTREALAELALIAPDDPRVLDLLRERSQRSVDTPENAP